jgi:glutamate racemase
VDARPIGLFDSGVGGLSIARAARRLLPHESMIYLADSGHFPYGAIAPTALRALTTRLAAFLLERDCKLIVVACNTASVHTLSHLRATFPGVPFVGVVPVVKTLATRTRTGVIALLATPATAHSSYLADLIAGFAPTMQVITVACEGLAEHVEQGDFQSSALDALLARYLAPVRAGGADVLGLACTHYPFLRSRIRRLLGGTVRVYDSSSPVARRIGAVLAERDALARPGSAQWRLYATGDAARLTAIARRLRFPPTAAHVAYAVADAALPATTP